MYRRLGEPLPHQLANTTQVHLVVMQLHLLTFVLSGISDRFQSLSPSDGQITYVLLTRSPLTTEVVRSTCMY